MNQSRAGFAALDAWLDRQSEPVVLVTMESSGHYWMPIATHLRRRDVPAAVVNPLAAKYFAKSRPTPGASPRTIPGVGPATTATLIAEIGDIDRFADFDQLLAYAGIHPAERNSGRKRSNPENLWHVSEAGNSHLRAAAYRMAVVGIQHNPVIAAHYARKRAAGKTKINALGHLHTQGVQPRLGCLAQWTGLRPQLGARGLTTPYGI